MSSRIITTENMEFKDIITRLAYGRKVRRAAWPEEVYIEYNGGSVTMKTVGYDKPIKKYAISDRLFSIDDIFAEDWEIIK